MRDDEQAIYDQIEQELGRPVAAALTINDAATTVLTRHRVVHFRGSTLVKVRKPYMHFAPMDKEAFNQIAYPLVGGMPKSRMNDTFAYLRGVAKDITNNDHYILFGAGTHHQTVWDMERLEVRPDVLPDDCVWRSPYALIPTSNPIKFIMDLAGGDRGLYSDIMQSLAPLVMVKKPVGVVWWTGDDTDGKLAITRALNEIFPGQLSSLSVKQLNGGRSNTPLLNDMLGNVAEDINGQITNTEIYKNIGAHQDFNVHRFHRQSGIKVRGNVHHIFLASREPAFYTKSFSLEWRTHTVSFRQFDVDRVALPNNFLGQLVAEMCKYAALIKQRGYHYEWSATTHAPNW